MNNFIEQVVYFEVLCKKCAAKKNSKGMSDKTRPEFQAELEEEGWEVQPDKDGVDQLYCQSCKTKG